MKKGDHVTIFEDPITRELPEGEAVLVRKVGEMEDVAVDWHFEDWQVRFPDGTFRRRIRVDHD